MLQMAAVVIFPCCMVILPDQAARRDDRPLTVPVLNGLLDSGNGVGVEPLSLVGAGGYERAVGVDEVGHVLQLGEVARVIPLPPAGAEIQRNEVLVAELLDRLDAPGLCHRRLGAALDEVDHPVADCDGGVDNCPAAVLPGAPAALRIDPKKPVARHPIDVGSIKILKPLPVVTKINRTPFHPTTDQHGVHRRKVGPVVVPSVGNGKAHRPLAGRPINANAVAALDEIKPIPGRNHVTAVARDVGAAHFRAGEAPQHSAVVGVQPE